IEVLVESRILVGTDVPAEERQCCGGRDGCLIGRAQELREKALLAVAAGRIAELPFRVVEVVIGTPDGVSRLKARRGLTGYQQHAIKRLDTLQIEDIAVAIRQ